MSAYSVIVNHTIVRRNQIWLLNTGNIEVIIAVNRYDPYMLKGHLHQYRADGRNDLRGVFIQHYIGMLSPRKGFVLDQGGEWFYMDDMKKKKV